MERWPITNGGPASPGRLEAATGERPECIRAESLPNAGTYLFLETAVS